MTNYEQFNKRRHDAIEQAAWHLYCAQMAHQRTHPHVTFNELTEDDQDMWRTIATFAFDNYYNVEYGKEYI